MEVIKTHSGILLHIYFLSDLYRGGARVLPRMDPDSTIEEHTRLFRTTDAQKQARALSDRIHEPMIEAVGSVVDFRRVPRRTRCCLVCFLNHLADGCSTVGLMRSGDWNRLSVTCPTNCCEIRLDERNDSRGTLSVVEPEFRPSSYRQINPEYLQCYLN